MTEIWAASVEWTSEAAKAQFEEYQRLIAENADKVFGGKQIGHRSGEYQRLQARHIKETEHFRRLAMDLCSRFTRTVELKKKIDQD
jgi:hypothetical protein